MIIVGGRVDKIVHFPMVKSLRNDPILSKHQDVAKWILENFSTLVSFLIQQGYQPLIRFHCREHRFYGMKEQNKYRSTIHDHCSIIDDDDGYLAYQYSDFAITYFTSTCYELYLYDLPTLEIGNAMYLFRWGYRTLSHKSKQYFSKYQDSLVFGQVVEAKDISLDLISEFISKVQSGFFQIKDFKYLSDHPLYADTYYNSVDHMFSLILNFYLLEIEPNKRESEWEQV